MRGASPVTEAVAKSCSRTRHTAAKLSGHSGRALEYQPPEPGQIGQRARQPIEGSRDGCAGLAGRYAGAGNPRPAPAYFFPQLATLPAHEASKPHSSDGMA